MRPPGGVLPGGVAHEPAIGQHWMFRHREVPALRNSERTP